MIILKPLKIHRDLKNKFLLSNVRDMSVPGRVTKTGKVKKSERNCFCILCDFHHELELLITSYVETHSKKIYITQSCFDSLFSVEIHLLNENLPLLLKPIHQLDKNYTP